MCRAGGRRCPGDKTRYARKTVSHLLSELREAGEDASLPTYDNMRNRLYRNSLKLNRKIYTEGNEEDFVKRTNNDGGATYNVIQGKFVGGGFIVSPYPERSKAISIEGLSQEELTKEVSSYIEGNKDLLNKKGHYLGSWKDEESGKLYLDVSIATNKSQDARKISQEKDQIAFYDMQTSDEVIVDRNATSGQ